MDQLISSLSSQFPVASAICLVGYFFIQKIDKYNKSILEITVNSTTAITNCTLIIDKMNDSIKEVRETQLNIDKNVEAISNRIK